MSDRGRYDSAMFWLAFGTASAVIGLALMTIGVTRLPAGANPFTSPWFDTGAGLLALGVLLLLWTLGLYLARRRAEAQAAESSPAIGGKLSDDSQREAIKGYFAERERLMKMWERDRNRRKPDR
jgi:hypothetical protein